MGNQSSSRKKYSKEEHKEIFEDSRLTVANQKRQRDDLQQKDEKLETRTSEENTTLKKQAHMKNEDCERLRAENASLQTEVDHSSSELDRVEELSKLGVQSVRHENFDTSARVSVEKRKLEDQARIKDNDCKTLRAEKSTLQKEIDQKDQLLKESRDNVKRLEAENSRIAEDNKNLKKKAQMMDEDNKCIRAENSMLQTEGSAEKRKLKDNARIRFEVCETLRVENSRLKKENEQMGNLLKESSDKVMRLKAENLRISEENRKLQEKAQKEILNLKQENTFLLERLEGQNADGIHQEESDFSPSVLFSSDSIRD